MRSGWDSWKHRGVAFIGGHPSSECTGLFSWPHTSNIDVQWIWLTPTENLMPDWNVYRTVLMNLLQRTVTGILESYMQSLIAEKSHMADTCRFNWMTIPPTAIGFKACVLQSDPLCSPRISFNSSGLEPWWMWPDAQQALVAPVSSTRSTDYSERFLTDVEQIYTNLVKSLTHQNNGQINWWSWQSNAGDLCFQSSWSKLCEALSITKLALAQVTAHPKVSRHGNRKRACIHWSLSQPGLLSLAGVDGGCSSWFRRHCSWSGLGTQFEVRSTSYVKGGLSESTLPDIAFIHAAPRQGPPAPRLQGVICSSCCSSCCCCCVKIHAHFPHGCGTHFTVHTYLYTLAQGVKGCTRVESKLHVLTSGLSAVSDC